MIYSKGDPRGHCRRCSWLRDALVHGTVHPLPTVNGEPLDFSTYPAIGPVLTLS